MQAPVRSVFAIAALAWACACGGSSKGGDQDAGTGGADAEEAVCGDGKVSGDEECDDANNREDDSCRKDCRFTCGDGEVGANEECDVGIAAGETGACPTDCDDSDSCTEDAVSGRECATTCVNAPITATVAGDACCPAGANANTDSDCAVECGNGAVESGEVCDTGITAGDPGACPTDCADSQACTADVLTDAGSCSATCSNEPIVDVMDDDGCCPAGASIATDNDCSPGCDDGVVTPPETCDIGIASGDGACPTSCDDSDPCTDDNLLSAGTCNAVCDYPAITAAIPGDQCCPSGQNANTDSDCQPVCGNDVVESGEQCDDGAKDPGDGCDQNCQLEPVAFRISDLDLRDPHVYVDVFFSCRDLTDNQFFGFAVNSEIQTAVQTDDDGDGNLDLSLVLRFDPLDPSATTTGLDFIEAICTEPMASTSCQPDPAGTTVVSTANNQLMPMMPANCLEPIAGTTKTNPAYSIAPNEPPGPCFASDAETITVSLSGIPVTLSDAKIAAQYVGSPASNLVTGLIRGFISESDADATVLPDTLPVVGGMPLSSILPGGDPPGPDNAACAGHDDRDTGPGNVSGWYFYLDFVADVVPYTVP